MTPDPRPELDAIDVGRTRAAVARSLFGVVSSAPRVGRFEICGNAGEGAMGRVYIAFDPMLRRRVAIKRIRPDEDADYERLRRARLRKEARMLARVSHPNVVQVLDVGLDDGHVYLAMELVEGSSLGEWLAAAPRSVAAIVEVMSRAATGLAAAHAAGVVHRDFKPSNVLVDAEGRVKVADFGLASVEVADDSVTPARDTPASVHTLGTVGTPAYMAPEQRAGRIADARSDQYAFCVALYEALDGQRPFEDRDAGDPLRPPRRGSARLRRALARGLALDPDDRFATMDDLRAALRPRTRKTAVAAGIGLAVVAAAAIAWTIAPDEELACAGGRERVSRAWNADRAASVTAAFARTQRPTATTTAQRVNTRLDAYAEAWVAAHGDACLSARADPTALDQRMACLDVRRTHLRAIADAFARATAATVAAADEAVSALPRIEECADLDALEAVAPAPGSAATRAKIAAVETLLAEASARKTVGEIKAAATLLDDALAQAREIGHAPLVARAAANLGTTMLALGHNREAIAALEEAVIAAEEGGDMPLAIRTATDLAIAGVGRIEEAQRWIRYTDALVLRTGDRPAQRAALLLAEAELAAEQHQYSEAESKLRAALDLVADRSDTDTLELATLHVNLAKALAELGREDEAEPEYALAIAGYEAEFGPDHATVGKAIYMRAAILRNQRRFDEAREAYDRVLAIFEQSFDDSSPFTAACVVAIANVEMMRERWDEALPRYARAIELLAPLYPDGGRDLALVWRNYAAASLAAGDLAGADDRFARALREAERATGTQSLEYAQVQLELSRLRRSQRRFAEAEQLARDALAGVSEVAGPESLPAGYAHRAIADVLVELGRLDDARVELDRQRTILEEAFGDGHPEVAEVHEASAALDELRDTAGAE